MTARGERIAVVLALGLALVMFLSVAFPQDAQLPAPAYLGEAQCIACHAQEAENYSHALHAKVFARGRSELEQRGCESCHGPGSNHLLDLTSKANIIVFTRDSEIPIRDQNAQCLQCHKGGQRMHWPGSIHQTGDLGCSDCHNPMAQFSATGLLRERSINDTCFGCHQQQRMQFQQRSHMPLLEGKISCEDCHNPHGSTTDPLLKADTVNQVCYQCHAEKRGPFLWEHAPVRENCLNCHNPHGSNHEFLLVVARPYLCTQCHSQLVHNLGLTTQGNLGSGEFPDERMMNRSCQQCHSQIHGSNHPAGVKFHR